MTAMYFELPCSRGLHGARIYYNISLPMASLRRLIAFDVGNVLERSQRKVNPTRAMNISKYLLNNPKKFVLPALCGVLEGEYSFEESDFSPSLGILKINMDCEIILLDGQHRATGIIDAIKKNPDLGNISIQLFTDFTLAERQMAFVDINGHTVKPSTSLSDTYNTRNPLNVLLVNLANDAEIFKGLVDFETNIVPKNSPYLFTMKLLKDASCRLLGIKPDAELTEEHTTHLQQFWEQMRKGMSWGKNTNEDATTYRNNYIDTHGVFVMALASVGHQLLVEGEDDFSKLQITAKDLYRTAKCWQGRCVDPVTGNMRADVTAQKLTAVQILRLIEVPVPDKLKDLELQFFPEASFPEPKVIETKPEPAKVAFDASTWASVDPEWYQALRSRVTSELTDAQAEEAADKCQAIADEFGLSLGEFTPLITKLKDNTRALLNIRSLRAETRKWLETTKA